MTAATFLVVAHYTDDGDPLTGLADVTCNIDQYNPATQVRSVYLSAQAATESRDGCYYRWFTGDDAMLYIATFTTASADADQASLPALGVLFQRLEQLDADVSSRAVAGDAMALTPAERISTAGVFLATILEGAHTVADGLRIMLAALAGRSTGGGTFTNRFRDVGNTKNRIDATVDANGNRTAITIDGTP